MRNLFFFTGNCLKFMMRNLPILNDSGLHTLELTPNEQTYSQLYKC